MLRGHGSSQPFRGQQRLGEEPHVGDLLVAQLRPVAYNLCRELPDRQLHLDSLCQNINVVNLSLQSELILVFCVTSYKRSWQLKLSLPWNLLTLYPVRKNVRLFIADLNPEEDTELEDFFRDYCSLAHEWNYLHVFRGSILGWDASRCKNALCCLGGDGAGSSSEKYNDFSSSSNKTQQQHLISIVT